VSPEQAIANLIHLYAERIDEGDFAGVGRLFADAEYGGAAGGVRGAHAVEALLRGMVRTYDDGTPRTRHVTTNVIIEVDDRGSVAKARSVFTVFQSLPGRGIEPIASGRYHDDFEHAPDGWRFRSRRMLLDHAGDLSRHLRRAPPAGEGS
jgi:hypothetical protein